MVTGSSQRDTTRSLGRGGAISRWAGGLGALDTRYFAIDGGSGAAVLAELAGADPAVLPADAPRHADVLVIAEPVSSRLMPAVLEIYRDMDSPAVVVIAATEAGVLASEPRVAEHLPVASRIVVAEPRQPGALRALAASIREAARSAFHAASPAQDDGVPVPDEITVPPDERVREIATDDVVVSIGPIQAVTAGPCRFLLTMDGEQVMLARSEAGYATRGLEQAIAGRSWPDALALAPLIDPLAPVAGRLLLVRALEKLRAIAVPADVLAVRDAALRIERAQSHMVWLTRFAALISHATMEAEARAAATMIASEAVAAGAIVPGGWNASAAPLPASDALDRVRGLVLRTLASLEASRLVALRTRGVGTIALETAQRAGASGPVLTASADGAGDARARMLTRVRAAADDLRAAGEALRGARGAADSTPPAELRGAAAEAPNATAVTVAVEGPRGVMEMTTEAGSGDTIARVTWTRPSLKHLSLVPELMAGLTFPDALVAVASLDLSMAEADG